MRFRSSTGWPRPSRWPPEITIADVYEYVKNHQKEYQEFLKKELENKDLKVEDPYTKTIDDIIVSGKLEVPI